VMGFFWDKCLANYLPRLASNHEPPDLCLLSSWGYRNESPVPGSIFSFLRNLYIPVCT
jgi:hypothetical protein